MFNQFTNFDTKLIEACKVTVKEVFKTKKDERALIITNDQHDVYTIALCLYDQLEEAGAKVSLIIQPTKTVLDMAEESVAMALRSDPEIIVSLSHEKMGKDYLAIAKPYKVASKTIPSHFNYLMAVKKSRSFWAPGVTIDVFKRAVAIDYTRLKREASAVKAVLDTAEKITVTSASGTNVTLSVKGRNAFSDDGDFTQLGSGGNLPAGETYISPVNESCTGQIVFDGTISVQNGSLLVQDEPVTVKLEGGYVHSVTGGKAADTLRKTIEDGEKLALEWEKLGKLPAGQGAIYSKNARHIGELGIGLNSAADSLIGNMLIDEKAYKTCHFAIGANYDDDAPSLIHQDCVLRNPTITAYKADGSTIIILDEGVLKV